MFGLLGAGLLGAAATFFGQKKEADRQKKLVADQQAALDGFLSLEQKQYRTALRANRSNIGSGDFRGTFARKFTGFL